MALKKFKKKKVIGKKLKSNLWKPKSKKQLNVEKLDRLIDAKNPKPVYVSPEMKYVQENTMRAIPNLFTRPNEFIFKSGKKVPSKVAYHVHYTFQFEEYFMTGARHNKNSEFIYKVDKNSDIKEYIGSNGVPKKLIVKQSVPKPTTAHYEKKFMKRFFARKINEDTRPFEIMEKDFNKSDLYLYVSLVWFIKGTKSFVNDANKLSIAKAELTMPGVGRLLPDFQYFIAEKKVDIVTDIKEKLGIPIPDEIVGIQNTIVKKKKKKSNKFAKGVGKGKSGSSSSSPAPMTGPPAGVTSGGAGGGSGGGGGY